MVHGTCVDIDGAGVLITGPSGSGKSDLALRLIDGGGTLVADDQVVLARTGHRLDASSPAEIRGRMEVRGLGICDVPSVASTPVVLVVDLGAPDNVERLPRPARCDYLGTAVPMISIAPFEASAAAKVRLAVAATTGNSDAAS